MNFDVNALLTAHPHIAKILLIVVVLNEGLSLLPKSITRASSLITLGFATFLNTKDKLNKLRRKAKKGKTRNGR